MPAFGAIGAVATGTTSLSVPYPTGITAGQMLVLCITNKYPTNAPALPSGWVAATNYRAQGGAGANGIDTGQVYITIFIKEAVGTETGNLSITITSGNSAVGRMARYTKGSTKVWSYACANGADNTAGTAWSVTAGSNPGITANDLIIVGSAINADTYTYSAQAITATGATFGAMTERQDSGTTSGQDCALVITEHPCTAGTATAAPVYVMTASGSAANAPAGASVILRLREVDPPAVTGTLSASMKSMTGSFSGDVDIIGTLALTFAFLTANFVARSPAQGTLAAQLNKLTGAFTGLVTDGSRTGTMNLILAPITAIFTGITYIVGGVSLLLKPLSGLFSGVVTTVIRIQAIISSIYHQWGMR